VHAGHQICSLLAPGGTLPLLVHFKLILLMLPSFILLSLSVNLSFCLAHHVCDSYPVNSQCLTYPHCEPKLPLEKELTAASQGMLWRPKPEQVSSVKGFFTDSGKEKNCQTAYVSPVPSEGCYQAPCLPYALPEFTLGVALVLYLPALFPATSLLITQKSLRIHFLRLLPSSIPGGRVDSTLPPSRRQLLPHIALTSRSTSVAPIAEA